MAELISVQLESVGFKGIVNISGTGEATLTKHLVGIVKMFSDKGIHIEIVTNGDYLSIPKVKELFDSGLSFMYVSLYTPLKTKTPLSVFVGAFPGAIPFMLGWVAATNKFGIEPGVLFMIQFFWQFPHFWAIGWLSDDDYKKAGFKMLPTGKKDKSTAFQIVFYTIWTILVSLIPLSGFSGLLTISYISGLLIFLAGLFMLSKSINLMLYMNNLNALRLKYASIFYLTFIQIIFVLDKFII